MVSTYILLAVTILVALVFIGLWSPKRPLISFLLKGLSTALVITLAITTFFSVEITLIQILLISGLVCCLVGDLALALLELNSNRANIINAGTGAFGIAQAIFVVMLLFLSDYYSLYGLIFGLVFAVGVYFLRKPLGLNFGKNLIPSLIYAFLLSANFAGALIWMCLTLSLPAILLFVGFALFLISDLVLSMIYFGGKQGKVLQMFNIIMYFTYYAAIICIAISFAVF